jgi:tetratricopeptide (TPR) repeat protein
MTDEERLARHVAWSSGSPPWVGFAFVDDPRALRRLQAAAREALPEGDFDRVLTPQTPQQLRQALARVVDEPGAALVWVTALHDEAPTTPPGPWTEAWDWLLMRANERRQSLLQHVRGGLVLAMPRSGKARAREAAPDLWSVRAIVLEPDAEAPASAPSALLPLLAWDGEGFALVTADDPAAIAALREAAAARGLDARWLDPRVVRDDPPARAVVAGAPDAIAALPKGLRDRAALRLRLPGPSPRSADDLDASWSDVERLDALERAAGAIYQQGWADEAAAVADDLVSEARAAADAPRLASGLELRARAQRELGARDRAVVDLDEAVRLRQTLATADAPDAPLRRAELARAWSVRGQLLLEAHELDAAAADLDAALRERQALAAWSDDAETLADLALSWSLRGELDLARGDEDAAEEALREAARVRRRLADETGAWRHVRAYAGSLERWSRLLWRRGQPRSAADAIREAVTLRDQVCSGDPDNAAWTMEAASARAQLASILAVTGERARARQAIDDAVTSMRRLTSDEPDHERWAGRLIAARVVQAELALVDGDLATARSAATAVLDGALDLATAAPDDLARVAAVWRHLAQADAQAGRDPAFALRLERAALDAARRLGA